eukprot:CAMPEP_0178437622 /NCGR_PEP_ID=MMETSP0689_2-20121128/35109_1 /TAXON_ID=160604 /ORGANISM="Amphidinium massartii, Strain CS-259" /LENGTH=82 /DNA_ID=CAMNT_0020059873 /DNA_START=296 /DNA_END=544 /DNA_ORIENTATION=+
MAIPASCTRGGFTIEEATFVRPARSNSSSSGGKLPHVWLAASTHQSLITWTTHSPLSSTLDVVSFSTPPGFRHVEKKIVGGL